MGKENARRGQGQRERRKPGTVKRGGNDIRGFRVCLLNVVFMHTFGAPFPCEDYVLRKGGKTHHPQNMKTTFHEQPRKSLISIYIYIYHVLACLPQHICPGSSRLNVQRSASLRQNGSWPVGPQPGRGVSQRKTSSSTTGVNLGSAAGGVSPLILRRMSDVLRVITSLRVISLGRWGGILDLEWWSRILGRLGWNFKFGMVLMDLGLGWNFKFGMALIDLRAVPLKGWGWGKGAGSHERTLPGGGIVVWEWACLGSKSYHMPKFTSMQCKSKRENELVTWNPAPLHQSSH